jgi:hypothetical protein
MTGNHLRIRTLDGTPLVGLSDVFGKTNDHEYFREARRYMIKIAS